MIAKFLIFTALVCTSLALKDYQSAQGVTTYQGDGFCHCIYASSSQ